MKLNEVAALGYEDDVRERSRVYTTLNLTSGCRRHIAKAQLNLTVAES